MQDSQWRLQPEHFGEGEYADYLQPLNTKKWK
jgi:hypothetical protein